MEINPAAIITLLHYFSWIVAQLKMHKECENTEIIPTYHSCRDRQFRKNTTKAITLPAWSSPNHFANPFALALVSSGMHRVAEMTSSSFIFNVVYMKMTKGWIVPSLLIIPLYNWKNVDSRNIKKSYLHLQSNFLWVIFQIWLKSQTQWASHLVDAVHQVATPSAHGLAAKHQSLLQQEQWRKLYSIVL